MTRYELLDRIGVGGMAEIFRGKAVAAGGFEKPVAIKRILPHLSQDRRFVELLIAEAKVLSLLKHRNIVQIFDVGLGDDGQYFLVMEYVDGKDVGAVQRALETRRRRLPFDLCLHIGAEICEALEHAHTSRGPDGKQMALVHRDVSPSNVLLSRAGEIKLTDFGIAKRAESDATQGGAVRGKFAYISPEQARNEPLDPRSDVFSVGILLWELICNRRLFSALDDLAALRAVREPVVPRPTEIDSRLPPEIDQLLLTALAKDKTRRYASCGQLGQKLRSLRYSLDETSGDPATELAKIIDSTAEVERASQQMMAMPGMSSSGFDLDAGGESTVIRIHTADAFSARNNDESIVKAREVIDRFEEEETRQAQLTGDQLRLLRGGAAPDEADTPQRGRTLAANDDEELTRARPPLDPKLFDADEPAGETRRHAKLPPAEDPRMLAPRERRTPVPLPGVRPMPKPGRAPTVPPPIPQRTRDATPGPPITNPQPTSIPRTLHGTPAPLPVQPMPQPPQAAPPSMQPPAQLATPLPTHQASHQPPQFSSSSPPHIATPLPGQQMPHVQTPVPFASPQGGQPYYPPQPAGSYPSWGAPIAAQHPPRDATPTAQDSFESPMMYPQRRSMPEVAGFERARKPGLQPWMLVVGAVIMAALAFAITRAFIG